MKLGIKITGLIKTGGQLIGIKKGRKGGSRGSSGVKCEVMKFDANAKITFFGKLIVKNIFKRN